MPKARLSRPYTGNGRSTGPVPGYAADASRLASVQSQPAGPSCAAGQAGPACPKCWPAPSLGRPSEQTRLVSEREHPSRKTRPSPSLGNPSAAAAAWAPTTARGGPNLRPTSEDRGKTTHLRNSSPCPGSSPSSTTRRSPHASSSMDLDPREEARTRPYHPTVAGRLAAPWLAGARDPHVGLPPAECP